MICCLIQGSTSISILHFRLARLALTVWPSNDPGAGLAGSVVRASKGSHHLGAACKEPITRKKTDRHSKQGETMKITRTSTSRLNGSFFAIKLVAPLLLLLAAILLAQAGTSAAPLVTQSCVEDFTLDSDPSMPGFASSIFVHSPSGNFQLQGGGLFLFAGATDVVTFPGQTVTRAKISYRAFGEGSIIFEGTGDTKTFMLRPIPLSSAEV